MCHQRIWHDLKIHPSRSVKITITRVSDTFHVSGITKMCNKIQLMISAQQTAHTFEIWLNKIVSRYVLQICSYLPHISNLVSKAALIFTISRYFIFLSKMEIHLSTPDLCFWIFILKWLFVFALLFSLYYSLWCKKSKEVANSHIYPSPLPIHI
jgi:hypothetical protein